MSLSEEKLAAPHPPLTEYYASEQDRRAWVIGLFDRTAGDYERIERLLSLGSGAWYRRQALLRAGLRPGMQVIDVGVGTGLVARAAARIVRDPTLVVGVDPSTGMLEHAHVADGTRLLVGNAEAIPMPDASADFISMGYALRHVGSLSRALREMNRVLRPTGRICLLEITAPKGAWRRALVKLYLRGLVSLGALLLARQHELPQLMRYYWDTIESCVVPEAILAGLHEAGFVEVRRHVELGIFSEYQATKLSQ